MNTANGIATGVTFIDDMIGGIHKGEINTIAAFAGHCKTTLAVNIAYNALTAGNNVLYISLEVIKENIFFDFLSRHSNNSKFNMRLSHYKLKKRKLENEEWEYAKKVILKDMNTKIPGKCYIVDETEFEGYSKQAFEAKFREIERIAKAETGHGIDVIVVDHIQLLKFGSGRADSTGDILNEYISWFRQQCMNWIGTQRQVAFLILSQTNRSGFEAAKNNNGKYDMTAMAEANELERASTLVLTIYADSDLKNMGIAKVQILKYRDNRNEDEPTEVSIDLEYYLFGDSMDGASKITEEFTGDAISMIQNATDGGQNDETYVANSSISLQD